MVSPGVGRARARVRVEAAEEGEASAATKGREQVQGAGLGTRMATGVASRLARACVRGQRVNYFRKKKRPW